jgi:protein involved in polysaccharide export with SLBB domain
MRNFSVIFLTSRSARPKADNNRRVKLRPSLGQSVIRFWCLTLALLLASCASTPGALGVRASDYVYQLGRGDKVKVTVFGEEQLTGEYELNGSGEIAFPLLGLVKAAGLTSDGLRTELQSRLGAEYLRNPKVSVEIAKFRSVFILGEVAAPGEFSYSERLTVYALVARAGGFTYRANQTSVFIRHENARNETRYLLESGTAVQPGDTVRIGQRIF